jgi:hypothetical protein
MELLDICLTTTYFQFEDNYYEQNDGMAIEKSAYPVVGIIFKEQFEEGTSDTADHTQI